LVAARVEAMFGSGSLMREVDSALAGGTPPAALEAAGIGYREALAVREGRLSVDAAIAEVTRRTLRYARAQRTWFRRDGRIRWLLRDGAGVEALADAAHALAVAGAPGAEAAG
ncbi:MAG TPA: tRNA (adenosine(37)-N6)-dimethylallyltransferase MiaA, partial [Candidatus Dormibacteraeota bacterium]|nr:tRNA (adenosine(37)-N6)-dimethylallyltransferase MiaA [Candidatus Dormibacteraeota bacterium]